MILYLIISFTFFAILIGMIVLYLKGIPKYLRGIDGINAAKELERQKKAIVKCLLLIVLVNFGVYFIGKGKREDIQTIVLSTVPFCEIFVIGIFGALFSILKIKRIEKKGEEMIHDR